MRPQDIGFIPVRPGVGKIAISGSGYVACDQRLENLDDPEPIPLLIQGSMQTALAYAEQNAAAVGIRYVEVSLVPSSSRRENVRRVVQDLRPERTVRLD
jgi:hypothetical protein